MLVMALMIPVLVIYLMFGFLTLGLGQVAAEYEANGVPEDWDLEDIHMTTESRLAELIGAAAGRLAHFRCQARRVWRRRAGRH